MSQEVSKRVCHSGSRHESLTVKITVLAKEAPKSWSLGSFRAIGRDLFLEKQVLCVVCSAHLTLTVKTCDGALDALI